MPTASLALSTYQRTARSLGAKSAGSLAAALLLPSAHAEIKAYTYSSDNVAQVGYHRHLYLNIASGNVATSSSPLLQGYGSFAITASTAPGDHIVTGVQAVYPGYIVQGAVPVPIAPRDSHTYFPPQNFSGGIDVASAFASGTAKNNLTFNSYYSYLPAAAWANSIGYMAVKFERNAQDYFGWIKLQTNSSASQITVLASAYNTIAGQTLLTGQTFAPAPVPEPATSASLLALGAAGLVAYRRRKNLQRAV